MENTLEKNALTEVYELLGRLKISKSEQWMFDNYWNKADYEFLKDSRGKLQVHKKES